MKLDTQNNLIVKPLQLYTSYHRINWQRLLLLFRQDQQIETVRSTNIISVVEF